MYLVYDTKFHYPISICRTLADAEELSLTYWEEYFYNLYLEQIHYFDWYSHTWINKTLTWEQVEKFKQESFKGVLSEKLTVIYKIPVYH